MQVDEASVVEQMFRELLADLDLRTIIELDRLTHETAPEPGPCDDAAEWRAPGAEQGEPQSEPTARASQTCDPGAEVAALTAALDVVAAQDPASLPEAQALARSRALLQATERLKALSLEALADVETRKLHTLDDAPTLHAWIKALAVPGVDSTDVTLARRLRRVPQIRTEIRASRMSSRTAATLTTAVAKARPFLDRPDGLIDGLDGEQVMEGCWSTASALWWPSRSAGLLTPRRG